MTTIITMETELELIRERFRLPVFTNTDLVQHEDEQDDVRYIYKTTAADGRSYAVRIFFDASTQVKDLIGQARLCELYAEAGLNVPRRLQGEDSLPYMTLNRNGQKAFAVVEHWMPGGEPELLDINLIGQAGEWLGQMHRVCEDEDIPFSSESPWGMFGMEDELDQDAQSLKTALQESSADRTLYEELYALYARKRTKLKECWFDLPRGAVQGDFSLNNLLVNNEGRLCSIIDYHLAGTDAFVGHFAGEGAFLSYAAERMDDDSEETGDKYFNAFFEGYSKNRRFTPQELDILSDLVSLRRAFACYQVDNVLEALTAGDLRQVHLELEKMLQYMKRRHI